MFSLSSSVFGAVQMVQCSPADIKKPRRPSGWDCTLFSATFTVIQQHTHTPESHACRQLVSLRLLGGGRIPWSPLLYTHNEHMLGYKSSNTNAQIQECCHIILDTSTKAHACTKALVARASAGNMQLCGYDVIDFLHWLEAARCRAIRERWKVPRCVEY